LYPAPKKKRPSSHEKGKKRKRGPPGIISAQIPRKRVPLAGKKEKKRRRPYQTKKKGGCKRACGPHKPEKKGGGKRENADQWKKEVKFRQEKREGERRKKIGYIQSTGKTTKKV